jgi:hypothetical protein
MNKLYKIWQNTNNEYDTYDSAIVCAETEEEARNIKVSDVVYCWVSPEDVHVEEIGIAKDSVKKGIILASFNAG